MARFGSAFTSPPGCRRALDWRKEFHRLVSGVFTRPCHLQYQFLPVPFSLRQAPQFRPVDLALGPAEVAAALRLGRMTALRREDGRVRGIVFLLNM